MRVFARVVVSRPGRPVRLEDLDSWTCGPCMLVVRMDYYYMMIMCSFYITTVTLFLYTTASTSKQTLDRQSRNEGTSAQKHLRTQTAPRQGANDFSACAHDGNELCASLKVFMEAPRCRAVRALLGPFSMTSSRHAAGAPRSQRSNGICWVAM